MESSDAQPLGGAEQRRARRQHDEPRKDQQGEWEQQPHREATGGGHPAGVLGVADLVDERGDRRKQRGSRGDGSGRHPVQRGGVAGGVLERQLQTHGAAAAEDAAHLGSQARRDVIARRSEGVGKRQPGAQAE